MLTKTTEHDDDMASPDPQNIQHIILHGDSVQDILNSKSHFHFRILFSF